jgi:nitroreductase
MFKDPLEFIQTRRSIRKFKAKPVPKEDILKIIKAASSAPSGSNQQNWYFIVVSDKKTKEGMRCAVEKSIEELLAKVGSKKAKDEISSYSRYFNFFADAPCVICAVEKPYDSLIGRLLVKYDRPQGQSTSGIQGVAAAIENLLLAAHALGYGTCWMTGPLLAKNQLEKILKIVPPNNLTALIPIGKPESIPDMPTRKPIEEIASFR